MVGGFVGPPSALIYRLPANVACRGRRIPLADFATLQHCRLLMTETDLTPRLEQRSHSYPLLLVALKLLLIMTI
jgi:hypothetical protein